MHIYYVCRLAFHSDTMKRFFRLEEEITITDYNKLKRSEQANFTRMINAEASDPIIEDTPSASGWPFFTSRDKDIIQSMQDDDTPDKGHDFGGGSSEGAGASGSWDDTPDTGDDNNNSQDDSSSDSYDSSDSGSDSSNSD